MMEQVYTKSSMSGVVIKSLLGIFVAFFIALPRLAQGKFFGQIFFNGGFISDIIGSIIFTIIIAIIWFFLTQSLRKDKGAFLNLLFFILASIFSGIFLANSLIVITNVVSYYGSVDIEVVKSALKIAGLATFIAVIGSILVLPKIKLTQGVVRFANNAATIVLALALVSFLMYIIGNILAALKIYFLLNLYGEFFYGVGPISIFFSIFCVILAQILFLGTLAFVKNGVSKTPKHQEYYLSIVLVNGILELYVEIFRLVLKILGSRNENR